MPMTQMQCAAHFFTSQVLQEPFSGTLLMTFGACVSKSLNHANMLNFRFIFYQQQQFLKRKTSHRRFLEQRYLRLYRNSELCLLKAFIIENNCTSNVFFFFFTFPGFITRFPSPCHCRCSWMLPWPFFCHGIAVG